MMREHKTSPKLTGERTRGFRRAERANHYPSAYWRPVEKAGITPRERGGHCGKVRREGQWHKQRWAKFSRNCRKAKQPAAIFVAALVVSFRLLGRLGVVVSSSFSAVMVHRSITMRMRRHVRLCLVNVCRGLTIGEAMRGAPERDRGVRREHAESVKRGRNKCRPRTQSFAPSRKHHLPATARFQRPA